ncbi:glycoside hydrolase [Stereum hirsutum FP-91666 SS1]|uniref:glycoside hydrolase n=1 Tax=Stereum hirsutum (strain FP-91666) TaxID=721885 RepID=UPI000444A8CD|nr:glycoside hydrolase [Stereum hirsutum FP-91666 SS1]EIM85030.1 glycoside hydrolase [Stereum hirsutum FP-91666 SS1]
MLSPPHLLSSSVATALSILSGILAPQHVTAATVSSEVAQTFLGIGGSGAWWPTDLYLYPDEVKKNLSALLFSEDGMGISSYRYNVGGGGVNVTENPTRAIETFYVSPGVYNWSADASGVYFMLEAAAYGVPSITAFVNSAPAPLTSGGASCNGSFVNGTGLEYGTFVADVISHWRAEGVNITRVSPMNEPDNNFGPSPCSQEGMEVDPNQRAEVVEGLYEALTNNNLTDVVGIIVDESSSLSRATSEYSTWLPQVQDKVSALCHHTYDFPTDASYLSYIDDVHTNYPGVDTWMSEVCCSLGEANGTGRGWSGGYDPTITNALMFSGMVLQSFVLAGEPHYDFWTLVSNGIGCTPGDNSTCDPTVPNAEGWTDGVIYYDANYATNGNYELYLTKHFWTYKHFGNFVKPGSQRNIVTGDDASNTTLVVSTSDSYHVLAMNPATDPVNATLTFPDVVCATTAVRTSADEDFATVDPATEATNGTWVLALAATSLTTFTFERGAC